jgi:glycosyltransferase involved in cell wall biosynthesis
MTNIVILTGSHLSHNPRAFKEATALAEAGYDVEVLGAWTDGELAAQDRILLRSCRFRFTPVIDFTTASLSVELRRAACQARVKAGHVAFRFAGLQNKWQLGRSVAALGRACRTRKADLFIAHSEPALAVAEDLMKAGHRVGVDMEDWFSEDLLPEASGSRPLRLLKRLEQDLLRHGAHAASTSRAMSRALAEEYECRAPVTVYNAFPWEDRNGLDGQRKDRRREGGNISLHWYSQTLGPGRGLEDLFAALGAIDANVEIHLRGKPTSNFRDWLSRSIPKSSASRIFVHDLVPPNELLSRIAEHDIGFAGEMNFCRSRELTVTNKILHYLLAGLAVVASDTTGQREVAAQTGGAVLLYPSGDARALAARLNSLLRSPNELQRAKAAALTAAQDVFCWERQKMRLVESVGRALRDV